MTFDVLENPATGERAAVRQHASAANGQLTVGDPPVPPRNRRDARVSDRGSSRHPRLRVQAGQRLVPRPAGSARHGCPPSAGPPHTEPITTTSTPTRRSTRRPGAHASPASNEREQNRLDATSSGTGGVERRVAGGTSAPINS